MMNVELTAGSIESVKFGRRPRGLLPERLAAQWDDVLLSHIADSNGDAGVEALITRQQSTIGLTVQMTIKWMLEYSFLKNKNVAFVKLIFASAIELFVHSYMTVTCRCVFTHISDMLSPFEAAAFQSVADRTTGAPTLNQSEYSCVSIPFKKKNKTNISLLQHVNDKAFAMTILLSIFKFCIIQTASDAVSPASWCCSVHDSPLHWLWPLWLYNAVLSWQGFSPENLIKISLSATVVSISTHLKRRANMGQRHFYLVSFNNVGLFLHYIYSHFCWTKLPLGPQPPRSASLCLCVLSRRMKSEEVLFNSYYCIKVLKLLITDHSFKK